MLELYIAIENTSKKNRMYAPIIFLIDEMLDEHKVLVQYIKCYYTQRE